MPSAVLQSIGLCNCSVLVQGWVTVNTLKKGNQPAMMWHLQWWRPCTARPAVDMHNPLHAGSVSIPEATASRCSNMVLVHNSGSLVAFIA